MDEEFRPRVLSDEEIEMYLKGDAKDVDRLILYSLNRLAAMHVPCSEKVSAMMVHFDKLGGMEAVDRRAAFVDALIAKQNERTAMMHKVSSSTIAWALIAFLGFLAHSVWNEMVTSVKTASTAIKVLK